jgi:hypothetical protein
MVFVVLTVICKFVCLKRLVIVCMVGLKYVKVVLAFLKFVGVVLGIGVCLLCWMCSFIRLMYFMGNPLRLAMVCIVCHSVCFCSGFNGSECSLVR